MTACVREQTSDASLQGINGYGHSNPKAEFSSQHSEKHVKTRLSRTRRRLQYKANRSLKTAQAINMHSKDSKDPKRKFKALCDAMGDET